MLGAGEAVNLSARAAFARWVGRRGSGCRPFFDLFVSPVIHSSFLLSYVCNRGVTSPFSRVEFTSCRSGTPSGPLLEALVSDGAAVGIFFHPAGIKMMITFN